MNLCHRQVIDDDTCEACGLGKETSGHIFGSVRQLMKYGSSLALSSNHKESGIMNLLIWYGISFLSNMWGMTF